MTANLMKGFALSTHCRGGVLFREKRVMRWLETDVLGKEPGASPIAWHRSIWKGPLGDCRERPLSDDPRNAGRQICITKFKCARMDPFDFTQGYFVFKASIFKA